MSFSRRRSSLGMVLMLALLGVSSHAGSTEADGPQSKRITEIVLERDCPGCPTGSVLTLRRDGTATYTVTGKARFGSEAKVSKGSVRADAFEGIARLIVGRGFFALKDEYEDTTIRDGAWTSTSVTRDGQEKRVFRRDGSGPAALVDIERAIDAVKAKIAFTPRII